MLEKIIYLESIEPIDVYGVNNMNLELIRNYFPKIKIVARGNEIKVLGTRTEIARFENRMNVLIDYVEKYNTLTEKVIEQLMNDKEVAVMEQTERSEQVLVFGNNGRIIKPKTAGQTEMVEKFKTNDLLVAIGPAGTGKTYIAIALAVRALRNREVRRIVLTRPAVEAGERLGFLPGDLKDKLDPYLQPLYDALNDMIPARKLAEFMEDQVVQIAPLAYMRGRTLSDAFVILDEAQNATTNQVKMFLTRMGENSKFVVTGDITQIDLPNRSQSGLLQLRSILANINGISFVEFSSHDVLRHRLVRDIVEAYSRKVNVELQ